MKQSIWNMIFKYNILEDISLIDYLNSFYLSKSKIYTLFLENRIKINDKLAKREDLLKENDVLSIDDNSHIDFSISDKSIDVIYEDDYLLIINKPQGIIIHDEKENDNSLSNRVARYYKDNNIDTAIRFAHRLDYDTTGLIIYVKDMLTFSYINHFVENHEIKRTYRCLVGGHLNKKEGRINAPISGDRHNSKKYLVAKNGKEAITDYKVIKEYDGYSLVELLLKTGRTHQIRVHMSYLGHPLLGDSLYGGNNKLIKRVALHSYKLNLFHPVYKKEIEVICKLPSDMKGLV